MSKLLDADLQQQIREREDRLTRLRQEPEDAPAPRKNRFDEESQADPQAYARKIEELRAEEKKKQQLTAYSDFRELFVTQQPSRRVLPAHLLQRPGEKERRTFADLYEPISKERNRELLEKLGLGIREFDSRVEETPFNERFARYVQDYRGFMRSLLEYDSNRLYQCRLSDEAGDFVRFLRSGLRSRRRVLARAAEDLRKGQSGHGLAEARLRRVRGEDEAAEERVAAADQSLEVPHRQEHRHPRSGRPLHPGQQRTDDRKSPPRARLGELAAAAPERLINFSLVCAA